MRNAVAILLFPALLWFPATGKAELAWSGEYFIVMGDDDVFRFYSHHLCVSTGAASAVAGGDG